MVNTKVFSKNSDIPRFTNLGFKKIKIPDPIWKAILEMYNVLRYAPRSFEDDFNGDVNKFTHIYNIRQLDTLAELIHDRLKPIHEYWSGEELIKSFRYGIRSYNKGASLANHKDWMNTHHISSIIFVDKDLNGKEDWALDFQDHTGKWHKLYGNPGEMILYESATCLHGRPDIFQGNYFCNMFIHYKLKNYNFIETLENTNNVRREGELLMEDFKL
jgi:prolyl 4-hydroxylase